MAFLILLCILCLLAGIVLAISYKLQIGPWKREEITPIAKVQQLKALHINYAADYANFAEGVWSCIYNIGAQHRLSCPPDSIGLFCRRAEDQIALNNGQIIFRYEVPVEIIGLPGRRNQRPSDLKKELADIENHINSQLPLHLRGGYLYSGVISAWSGEHGCIRVEVHGVDRQIPVSTEGICI